jgi:hypothetical protein
MDGNQIKKKRIVNYVTFMENTPRLSFFGAKDALLFDGGQVSGNAS